jgi:hypothetical protein
LERKLCVVAIRPLENKVEHVKTKKNKYLLKDVQGNVKIWIKIVTGYDPLWLHVCWHHTYNHLANLWDLKGS